MKHALSILLLFIGIGVIAGVMRLRETNPITSARADVQYQIDSSSLPLDQSWSFATYADIVKQTIEVPVFVQSTSAIYIATTSSIYAFDVSNGDTLWQAQRENITSLTSTQIDDDVILLIISEAGKRIEAIDASSGQTRWEVSTAQAVQSRFAEAAGLVVAQDRVFVSFFMSRGTRVLALNIWDGKASWDASQKVPGNGPEAIHVYRDLLVVQTGQLWYLDRTTGEIKGSNPLPNADEVRYGNAAIYIITDEDGLRAVDPITLVDIWSFKAACTNASYENLLPVQSTSTLIHVRCSEGNSSEDNLYNVGTAGRVIWKFSPKNLLISLTPIDSHGYLLTEDMSIHAINLQTGIEVGDLLLMPAQWPGWGVRPNVLSDNGSLVLNVGNGQFLGFE